MMPPHSPGNKREHHFHFHISTFCFCQTFHSIKHEYNVHKDLDLPYLITEFTLSEENFKNIYHLFYYLVVHDALKPCLRFSNFFLLIIFEKIIVHLEFPKYFIQSSYTNRAPRNFHQICSKGVCGTRFILRRYVAPNLF